MQNVGGIQYSVVADTGELIKAEQRTQESVKKIDTSMRKMGANSQQVDRVTQSFDKLEKQTNSTNNVIGKFSGVLAGLATLTAANTVAQMADQYQTMSDRMRLATNSTEEFTIVQDRLLKSSLEAYRPLAEAQDVFVGISDNLREYGYNIEQILDINDSFSFSLVRSATSAQLGETAMRAYDRALARGKVNALEWQTISAAMPNVVDALGKTLNKTGLEIRAMGNESEITAKQLNDALLESMNENKEAASSMAVTIEGAFTNVKTNLMQFIGQANETTGATKVVASAIEGLANNIDLLAKLLAVAAGGAIAKYVTQLGVMTVAKMKDVVATRSQLTANLQQAQAQAAAAKIDMERSAAMMALGGSYKKAAADALAYDLAVAKVNATQKAAAISARSLLAFLGGPAGLVGILAMGATALIAFGNSAKDARIDIVELHQPIDQLKQKIEEMGEAQRKVFMDKYRDEQSEALIRRGEEYDQLAEKMRISIEMQRGMNQALNFASPKLFQEITERIDEARESGADLTQFIQRLIDEFNIPSDVAESWNKQNNIINATSETIAKAAENYNILAGAVEQASRAMSEASREAEKQKEINEGGKTWLEATTKALQSQADSLSDNGSALKKFDRELQAQIDSGVKFTKEQEKQNQTNRELAEANDLLAQSRRGANKELDKSNSVLQDLQRELELATLSGKELAIARAENRLNEFATEAETQAVRELAGALYTLQEARKLGDTKEEQDKNIMGDVKPLSGGAFDDQVARYEAEAVAEQERYEQSLERLRLAREAKLQTEDEFNQLEADMKQRHEDRMAQIAQASVSVQLKAYSSAFSSMASIMKGAQGEQSGIYKAMFAASKAFAIAEATLNLNSAIMQAMADPSAVTPAQKFANWALVAGAGAQMINAISDASYGGGRQYGGAVSPDKMYRINETGESEVFDAGGGKQYFIPNQHGKIIPANKVAGQSGSSASNVTVNLIEDSSRGGTIEDQSTSEETILDVFVANIYSGGIASQAIEGTYGLTRKGR